MENIRIIRIFWVFYIKLFFPSIIVALLISLPIYLSSFSLTPVGISYIFISPLFHFLTYELRNEKEYYFYFNQGFSKVLLWTLSCIAGLFIGLLLIIL